MKTALWLLLASLTAVHAAPAKRLIATGWDSPTPAQFREHVASFEQWPCGATARWKTAAGKWTAETMDVQLSVRMPEAEGWRECVGLVQVPPSAEQLVLLLVARGQVTDQDRAWFDDIRVVPMK